MSLSCLKQISTERDISKISQKHLKKDVFFEASLRHLNYISKKMFSGDVFMASQTYLKKDVSSVTSLIWLKNIFWKYWWLFKNIIQKWFRGDKIDVWALKTLKKSNGSNAQPLISLSCGLMFACCLSQQYGLQIIWQFWHFNNRQISGAGVLFTAFSDFFKW